MLFLGPYFVHPGLQNLTELSLIWKSNLGMKTPYLVSLFPMPTLHTLYLGGIICGGTDDDKSQIAQQLPYELMRKSAVKTLAFDFALVEPAPFITLLPLPLALEDFT
jgi:hypothetical protein